MGRPLVSVVMPCRNVETTLRPALHSLLGQTLDDFEILMVDDGSTDGTASIIGLYRDPRIKIIRFRRNKGIAAALNAGLDAARGKYIARMDADDISYDIRFEHQVELLEKEKGVSLIGTGADVFGSFSTVYRSPATHRDIVDGFLVNNPFIHPTIMFRRSLCDKGLYRYNENYFTDEDYELWARLLPVIETANLGWSSIRYRRHAGNNQLHPQVYEAKVSTLRNFCKAFRIQDKLDPAALAELQCSGFITRDAFVQLQRYAEFSEATGKPKLGWLHHVFLRGGSYESAVSHYDRALGYRPYWNKF